MDSCYTPTHLIPCEPLPSIPTVQTYILLLHTDKGKRFIRDVFETDKAAQIIGWSNAQQAAQLKSRQTGYYCEAIPSHL